MLIPPQETQNSTHRQLRQTLEEQIVTQEVLFFQPKNSEIGVLEMQKMAQKDRLV